MIPPELNRYYVLDLAPGRSMVEYAVSHGIQTFMVVWRNPQQDLGHGLWSLEEYIAAHVRAIDVVREIVGSDTINLLGLCAGGITSALAQAHLTALGANPVNSATYLVTMLEDRLPNMATMLATPDVGRALGRAADKGEVLKGRTIRNNFAWMRPNDLVFGSLVNNWLLGNQPPAFDVLAWNDDATNMAAAFERDAVHALAGGRIRKPGALTILGTPLDLGKVDCDSFMVAGLRDHITTWQPCYRSSQILGGSSEVVVVDSGHIQSFVNPPGSSRYNYWAGPADGESAEDWISAREKTPGSWWALWIEWLAERSDDLRKAPTALGSKQHTILDPAPGRYVHE
jgi:polyhydroxyalkanoate synthase